MFTACCCMSLQKARRADTRVAVAPSSAVSWMANTRMARASCHCLSDVSQTSYVAARIRIRYDSIFTDGERDLHTRGEQ